MTTEFINEEEEERILLILSNHGIYIPQLFCQMQKDELYKQDLKEECDVCLGGPYKEDYWECWDDIINKFTLPGGMKLDHDEDLWAVKV